jgi:hypothetical protein
MDERFLKVVGFGLIGEDAQGGPFRQVIFKETESETTGEFLVFKRERPSLWTDIEKLERGGNIPPYRGKIIRYNSIDLIVFGDETIEDAFIRQRWKLKITSRITYAEAENNRTKSLGYITNLTPGNAMEISWRPIDTKANLVKFRAYNKCGTFLWTNWYEIVSG